MAALASRELRGRVAANGSFDRFALETGENQSSRASETLIDN